MSYFAQNEAGSGSDDIVMGPQQADILAIEQVFGLSTTTRTGNTVYGFNANAGQIYSFSDAIYAAGGAPALTLFDNGGTDTLDLSGYGQIQRIDLNTEAWSDIGGKINNIAIARGTIIANAIGGSGVDTITDNGIANVLSGGLGADTIYGNDGNATLNGGDGNDELFGGNGVDSLVGGNNDDTLVGNADIFAQEVDTFNGGTGNDSLYGEFTDTIIGGASADLLYGVKSYGWTIDLGATSIEWMSAGYGNDTITAAIQTVGVTVYGGGGDAPSPAADWRM
jgi:serralysin